ncbi:MAG: BON domain-containing protein [Spirochaetes bacterium]|jgi:osmotically-inducible protein OsmY|nr:BON domain-containing protein [Spirochaetota bacterium]
MLRTNAEIERDIVDQLYWDTRLNAEDVQVDVQDGEVMLFGAVDTDVAKRAAEEDAWAIGGVSEVANAINVELAGGVPERERLTGHIANLIAWDPQIDERNVDVTAQAGEVTLEGTVDAYWKKLRLHDLVRDVRGVTRVVDKLTVVPTRNVADETIAEEVVEALRRNEHVDVDTIDVTVENGHVTMSGSVPTWFARNSAYESAVVTFGVVDVDVSLDISS